MLGDGPVRTVGLGPDGALRFSAPSDSPQNAWAGSEWGGGKVLWAVAPGQAGSFVIRGRQLDGPGFLRFGQANLPDETLVLPAAPASADDTTDLQNWRSYPSSVRMQHEGCYGFQIESPTGTTTIVFAAARS
jgi:hypothetical protein